MDQRKKQNELQKKKNNQQDNLDPVQEDEFHKEEMDNTHAKDDMNRFIEIDYLHEDIQNFINEKNLHHLQKEDIYDFLHEHMKELQANIGKR